MNIKRATLKKKESEDKCYSVFDDVQVGKEYFVDMDTKQLMSGYNIVLKKEWKDREMVRDIMDGGYLPTELLEIHDDVPQDNYRILLHSVNQKQ